MIARRVIAAGLSLVLTALLLELALGAFDSVRRGRLFWTRVVDQLSGDRTVSNDTRQKLSPIYGYALRPGWKLIETVPLTDDRREAGPTPDAYFAYWPANNYGFTSQFDYPHVGPPGTVHVVILGGSVANGLALEADKWIAEAVKSAPGFETRNVAVINLSTGGFKQPQQALALAYFVSIGQPLDLVINLDGFNEAYVGWHNARRYGVEPALPWIQFVYGLQNYFLSTAGPEAVVAEREIESARAAARSRATTRSAIVYFVQEVRLGLHQQRANDAESELSRPVAGRKYPFIIQQRQFEDDEKLAEYLASVWFEGSLLTKAMAGSAGAPYIHILQPNQYVGPRKFSSAEAKVAFSDPPFEGAKIVPLTYARMIPRGDELRRRGVNFLDLTAIFDNVEEPLYFDACCHFSRRGYELLVRGALDEAIRTALAARR